MIDERPTTKSSRVGRVKRGPPITPHRWWASWHSAHPTDRFHRGRAEDGPDPFDRRDAACRDERGGHHRRGGRQGVSRPDRPPRTEHQGVPPPRRRRLAGQGPRSRRQTPGRRPARLPGRRADRLEGCPLHQRRADHLRQQDARQLPAAVQRDGDRTPDRRRRRPRRQDEHGRVRDGLVDREQRLRPEPATPGTPTGFPAARRAARPRRSPPTSRRSRWGRTPAARSASPPRSAGSSGSSRLTGGSAATA